MNAWFLFSSAGGYFAVFLIALTIGLPYYLRRRGVPLRPHYLVGYAILVLAWAHSFAAMYAGSMSRANLTGLNAAMVALTLITVQAGLGQTLASAPVRRRGLTRVHFAIMLGIVAFVAVHLALNGALMPGGR